MHAPFDSAFLDHFDFTPVDFDGGVEHIRGRLEDPTQWLVAEHDGEIVGYARGSNRYASEGSGYVASIGVAPGAPGPGLARALLRARFADDIARGFDQHAPARRRHQPDRGDPGSTSRSGMVADSEFVWFHRPLFDWGASWSPSKRFDGTRVRRTGDWPRVRLPSTHPR